MAVDELLALPELAATPPPVSVLIGGGALDVGARNTRERLGGGALRRGGTIGGTCSLTESIALDNWSHSDVCAE